MHVTSTQQNSKTKRHNFVELSRYLNNSKGFTLVELLISIAIIGILAAVGIPQYTQYKIRAYDAHSKQALKDMHLLCNAYWLDTDTLQGCDLPKIKEATYGFNQNTDVVATLPPSPLDNFCASAKHNSSPNTYSIDSAALISDNEDCGARISKEEKQQREEENKEEEDDERGSPSSGEIACRKTWNYNATGTYEEEKIKAANAPVNQQRGEYRQIWPYPPQSALDNCRCTDGFRTPRLLMNRGDADDVDCQKDESIRSPWRTYDSDKGTCIFPTAGSPVELRAVARPCDYEYTFYDPRNVDPYWR